MKCCVLFASPRGEQSNTRALMSELLDAWHAAGHTPRATPLWSILCMT